uniref:Transposase (Putative), gypsy type n=1 Tax=Tanacetum cinerariifolium TaxID=118510 RepID=A0A6L2KMJ8_TANCI|nr:hypothetical protein [Tanacetum cinerariifolium]
MSIVEAKLSSRGGTSVANMYQTLSYVPKLSYRGSAQCCSLPPEGTSYSLPPEKTDYSLPPEEIGYSLPPEETGYSLPPEKTGYFLPLEGTSYSLVIASRPEKDMHTYISRLKDIELETLIFTYDIPLDLRPRLPDPNFRMINILAGDTAIGIYSRIFDSSGVRIPFSSFLLAVLQYFKVHISQLVPLDKVPTSFKYKHVDQLKAHIAKLYNIPKVVLARSGLSRVWRNLICDPALRRSDNTVMSIYDFLSMPFLDKVTVREEPHGLDTFILGRVIDRTTSPALAGTTIPRTSSEEIIITRLDRKVVTKADHAAKRKASTGPEISTNVVKKTRSNKKGSAAGSSGQAAGDEVEQTDDGTLDDHDQRDGSEFAMEGVSEDASPHAQEATPAPDAQPLDADAGADEIACDGFKSKSPPYTKYDWEKNLRVNLGMRKKELYKDLKVCRTTLDRFPIPAETHRLRELSLVELSDRMSMLQCQLITHGSMLKARYDHSLRNVERLSKQCAQQTQTIKRQSVDLKQQNESTIRANKEVSRLTTQLWVFKSRCQMDEHKRIGTKSQLEHRERQAEEIQGSVASFFQSYFTPLVRRFLKSGEFNRAFAGVLNMEISVGVECGLRMDRIDEEFRMLSQRVVGFIPDAKEKFDRVVVAFPDTTIPFLDKYGPALPEQLLRCGPRART